MGKKGLGRGISAIFGDHALSSNHSESAEGEILQRIPLDQIDTNPYQPRRTFNDDEILELAQTIKEHGIIQPITVRKHHGRYQIVSGERRTRAARVAGLTEIEARVHEMLSDKSMMEWAIIENVQRVDLNAIEIGLSYQQLIEHHGYTHEVLADRVGKSRSAITNSLRLLKLPESVQGWISEGKLSAGAARTLLNSEVGDPEAAALKIMEGGLNVRQAEKQQKEKKQAKTKVVPSLDPNLARLVEDFQYALGTRVTLQSKAKDSTKGTLVIEYESWEDLERMRNLVAGN